MKGNLMGTYMAAFIEKMQSTNAGYFTDTNIYKMLSDFLDYLKDCNKENRVFPQEPPDGD